MNIEELKKLDFKVKLIDGKEYDGLLIDIDYDIGITIVDKYEKDMYIYCLLGRLGFKAKWGEEKETSLEDEYDEKFEIVTNGIKNGYIEISKLFDEKDTEFIPPASIDNCGFNQ